MMCSQPNYFGQRPLDIIFHNSSYQQAIDQVNLASLGLGQTKFKSNLIRRTYLF